MVGELVMVDAADSGAPKNMVDAANSGLLDG